MTAQAHHRPWHLSVRESRLCATRSWGRRRAIRPRVIALLFVCSAILAWPAAGWTHDSQVDSRPVVLREVAFDQRVNEQVPLDLVLRDEEGRPVSLGRYFGKKPIVLALVYYRCRNLCPVVLEGLVRSLRAITFDVGKQFDVVVVSFDSRDLPGVAAAEKTKAVQQYGRPGTAEGWHFLTGEETIIQRLTRSVGFRATYDIAMDQYRHATGIVVLTPQGKLYRYLYGIEYSSRDLRLSLIEASGNRVGTPLDQVLLFCYSYDPTTGKYTVLVMNVIRLAGLMTVGALGAFIAAMWRRDSHESSGHDPRV